MGECYKMSDTNNTNDVLDINLDGITHINIYSQSNTELGRMLSNFHHFNIVTVDGEFSSVEGYWYWLGIEDCKEKEVLRKAYGYRAKKIGNELKKKFKPRIDDDFENKIMKAIWYKARRNMDLFDDDIATLPFEHYYNFGGKIVDVKDKYTWMIDGINRMRDYILKTFILENIREEIRYGKVDL